MFGRLPSLTLVRFIALVMMATIATYVCEPVRSLQPSDGSAFSASSYQVAVTPPRRADMVQAVLAPVPLPPTPLLVESGTPAPLFDRPATRPDSTGPPAKVILARQPAPRAPPLV